MLDYFGNFIYNLNLQRRLMKRHINIIMVLVLGFVLTACSGRMVQLPTENIKSKEVPAW